MAMILHEPSQHRCAPELAQLDRPRKRPIGTVAECSCGKRHVVREDGRGERGWDEMGED